MKNPKEPRPAVCALPDDYSDPLDEVADQVCYLGESPVLVRQIYQAVLRLPIPVRRFVYRKCTFVSGDHGICLPMAAATNYERRATKKWLIVLKERLPKKHAMGIIAHEVAHAWLGHDRYAVGSEDQETWETAAATLTGEWGFTGVGADPKHCNAPFEQR